jgi:16S rRNA processing protein RimM
LAQDARQKEPDVPPTPTLKDHVLLGVIGSAHGIKGEVSITTFTEDPADIGAYGALTDGKRTFEIESLRVTPKAVLARIVGVADRTTAEKLRNVPLFVTRDALPEIDDDGTYYQEDLKGLSVVDPAGKTLGTVVEIVNFGAGDLVEVHFTGARDTEYFPFTDAVVPSIDLEKRTLTLIPPATTGDDEREKE